MIEKRPYYESHESEWPLWCFLVGSVRIYATSGVLVKE